VSKLFERKTTLIIEQIMNNEKIKRSFLIDVLLLSSDINFSVENNTKRKEKNLKNEISTLSILKEKKSKGENNINSLYK
tara:strand:+ start:417 stop:653 length:237 start_codon:yes stop_codon:yes gene_type:complete